MGVMRYFAVVQSNPRSPDYGMAQGVMRFVPSRPERFDRFAGGWVDHPDMVLGFTGLGGDSDYVETTEEFVDSVLAAWRDGKPAPKVKRSALPV